MGIDGRQRKVAYTPMPVTSISSKLRVFFLQTRMLYRGGGGEILGLFRNRNAIYNTLYTILLYIVKI